MLKSEIDGIFLVTKIQKHNTTKKKKEEEKPKWK